MGHNGQARGQCPWSVVHLVGRQTRRGPLASVRHWLARRCFGYKDGRIAQALGYALHRGTIGVIAAVRSEPGVARQAADRADAGQPERNSTNQMQKPFLTCVSILLVLSSGCRTQDGRVERSARAEAPTSTQTTVEPTSSGPHAEPTYPGAQASPQAEPHVEREGLIAFDAEQFAVQAGFQAYLVDGTVAMRAVGGSESRLDYTIQVNTSGRFLVRIRTYAMTHTDNGLHLALNGNKVQAPADHALAGASCVYLKKVGWSWDPEWQADHQHSGPVTVDLKAGRHVFSILKRKIEVPLIDRIELRLIEAGQW